MLVLVKTTYPATLEKPEGEYFEDREDIKSVADEKWLLDFILSRLHAGAKIETVKVSD